MQARESNHARESRQAVMTGAPECEEEKREARRSRNIHPSMTCLRTQNGLVRKTCKGHLLPRKLF